MNRTPGRTRPTAVGSLRGSQVCDRSLDGLTQRAHRRSRPALRGPRRSRPVSSMSCCLASGSPAAIGVLAIEELPARIARPRDEPVCAERRRGRPSRRCAMLLSNWISGGSDSSASAKSSFGRHEAIRAATPLPTCRLTESNLRRRASQVVMLGPRAGGVKCRWRGTDVSASAVSARRVQCAIAAPLDRIIVAECHFVKAIVARVERLGPCSVAKRVEGDQSSDEFVVAESRNLVGCQRRARATLRGNRARDGGAASSRSRSKFGEQSGPRVASPKTMRSTIRSVFRRTARERRGPSRRRGPGGGTKTPTAAQVRAAVWCRKAVAREPGRDNSRSQSAPTARESIAW